MQNINLEVTKMLRRIKHGDVVIIRHGYKMSDNAPTPTDFNSIKEFTVDMSQKHTDDIISFYSSELLHSTDRMTVLDFKKLCQDYQDEIVSITIKSLKH